MERREEEYEGEFYLQGLDKAFTILHDAPALPASRQQKTKKDQKPTARDISRQKLLEHHAALYQGEPDEYRLLRADAMDSCWEQLSSRIQATLDGTDQQVFSSILHFVKDHHKSPLALANISQSGYHRVPTALVLAGGVNSADHSETFPQLVKFMKDKGLYVALLQPHSFGRTVGDALNEVLRQLSGLDTQAQHAEALIAWYYDEVGHPSAAAQGRSPVRPSARSACGSPAALNQGGSKGASGQRASGGGEGGATEPDAGRQLRHRRGTDTVAGGVEGGVTERQRGNWGKPLVVVVEGTESLDAGCLRDVMLTLSECGGQIPITVVLGLTTAEAALHEMLSSEVTDRCMDCRSFKLASAMTRMNRLVSNVLLGGQGGWPGLVFDGSVISALVKKFYTHYYSTSVWKHGLQLVALEHFRTQPTSFLAASSLKQGPQDALRAACTKLPLSVAAEVKKAAGGKGGAKAADAFQDFLSSWYRWAVAVHWVVLAARCAGLPGSCWQYVHVLEDALDPKFDTTRTAKGFMDLERLLKKLLPEQVCHLAGEMQNVVRQVEGAEAVLAEEVQQLQAIAEEASPPANEQDARAEEEGGQPGSSGNPAGAPESDSLPAPADAPGGRQQRSQQQEGGGVEEGKSAQQEKDAPPRAAASRKREVYHSKASRQKALLEKASQAAAASKGAAARELERKAQEAAAPGAKLAAWLLGVLRRVLGTPPTKLPGSAPFTCKAASAVHSLSGSFRQVVHAGLTQPHLFLSGIREQVGVDAQMEDACLAYMLFDQDPNCVNVADWFQAFCDVHLGGGQQEGERSPQVKKKTAVKGKRKLGGGQGGAAQVRGAEKAEKMRELAARFTQATSELQLIGLIKPAKRRRGDFVQRLVHMPAEAV